MKDLKVHIIGGTGSMGNWLKNFLEAQGIGVTVSGRKGVEDKILKNADIVFISVPISLSPNIILETSKKVNKDCLLVDLSSVVSETTKALKATKLAAANIHPLFGPTISSIQNQKIILSRIKTSKKIETLIKILTNAGAQVIEMTPAQHDLQMANIQNLVHFANLTLAKTLIDNEINLTGKISTPVFLAQLSTLSRVISKSPELLSEIQLGNSSAQRVLEDYIEYQIKVLDFVKNNDNKKLTNEFSSIHQAIESATGVKKVKEPLLKAGKNNLSNKICTVGYLGPEGTFTHQATKSIVSSKQKLLACKNIFEIFEKVASGEIEYGVVPAENSTEGTVRETLDYLVDFNLVTNFSIDLVIHQTLMSHEKNMSDIKRVISHPQAIAQSREWLRQNLPNAKIETAASTVVAAQDKDSKNMAVIGPLLAAKVYKLNILAENIEDNTNNVTKFYVISKEKNAVQSATNKTLLFLTVFNRVGVLRDVLTIFADNDINLTKLESRPSGEKIWDYHFFIEVDCNQEDPRLVQTLNIMKQYCPVIKVLGGV